MANTMQYYVYILATNDNKVVYTGVTNDLRRRVYEHKNSLDKSSFTSRYRVNKLVHYEYTGSVEAAIAREKQIKGWNRNRKNKLVESENPEWRDLYPEILE